MSGPLQIIPIERHTIPEGYYLLARSVIEQALSDCREPEICTRCGSKFEQDMIAVRCDLRTAERDREIAFRFLTIADRCSVWGRVAKLDASLLAEGASKASQMKATICGCYFKDRGRDCPYGKGRKGKEE